VIVTVVDRGPLIRGRVIDVSASPADELGFRREGVARVKLERL
jgi:rare lipoprotein A